MDLVKLVVVDLVVTIPPVFLSLSLFFYFDYELVARGGVAWWLVVMKVEIGVMEVGAVERRYRFGAVEFGFKSV